jgi:cell division protein FtsA
VDFGGGTTDLVIFHESSVRYTSVIGVGGNNLTNDLAVGLRTPMDDAEKIKQRHGCVLASMIGQGETLEVQSMGGRQSRQLDRSILGDILEPRMEEILYLLQNEILKSGYADLLASGVVFTGGASLVEGLAELSEQILGQPARVGYPVGVEGLKDIVRSPMYATGVGLVLHARRMERRGASINVFRRGVDSMKRWFKEVF